MTVWLNDLKGNWLSWLAVFVTCVVSSCGCTVAMVLLSGPGGDAGSLGGTILGMAVCAIVIVTWSQIRLIIDEHRAIYRSWRMVGMPGWFIITLVLGQIAVVSAAGSGLGGLSAQFPLPLSIRRWR